MKVHLAKLVAALAWLTLATPLHATDIVTNNVTTRVATKLQSRYVADDGVLLDRSPVSTTDLFLLWQKHYYFDLAYIKGFADHTRIKQTQFTLGARGALSDQAKLRWNLGLAYLDASPLLSFREAGFLNPYLQVQGQLPHNFVPYLRFDTVWPVQGQLKPLEKQVRGGLVQVSPLLKERLALSQRLVVLYEQIIAREMTITAAHELNLSLTMGPHLSLDLTGNTSLPIHKGQFKSRVEYVPSFTLGYKF